MASSIIKTKLKSTELVFGDWKLKDLSKFLAKKNLKQNVFLIVDENVWKHWREEIFLGLEKFSTKLHYIIVPSGESSKSFTFLQKILAEMQKHEYGRDTLVIAIGGGVTGDLAGFAASIYTRGVQLIHIPSTLLAMVDSSIGGKTGINFLKKKNIIGSFYQPDIIFTDIRLLKTLPETELRSGYGEVIKYAFLSDTKFYDFVSAYNFKGKLVINAKLQHLIQECMKIKAGVVEQDEHEVSVRKILNLGHTFGHAFESDLNFSIMHGEAVAFGTICALYLSHSLELINDAQLKQFLKIPLKVSYPQKLRKIHLDRVMKYMKSDKKNANAKPRFVLVRGAGELVVDIEADEVLVRQAITDALKHIKA